LDLFQAAVLGLVQGVAEFIPISSSAHLIIIPWLFGWKDPGLAFDVALHMGTLIAVLVYFWQDWVRLIRGALNSLAQRNLTADPDGLVAWYFVLATIPGAGGGAVG
jgi:undecaprenyl-diphosphatase